jgi:hypothetical protein
LNSSLEFLEHLALDRLLGRFAVLSSAAWQGPEWFVVGAMQQD